MPQLVHDLIEPQYELLLIWQWQLHCIPSSVISEEQGFQSSFYTCFCHISKQSWQECGLSRCMGCQPFDPFLQMVRGEAAKYMVIAAVVGGKHGVRRDKLPLGDEILESQRGSDL